VNAISDAMTGVQGGASLSAIRARVYLLGMAADIAMLFLAFALANLLVIGRFVGEPSKPHGLVMFAMIAPIHVMLAIQGGAYGIRALQDERSAAARACWAFAQALMVVLVFVYFGKIAERLSRLTFMVGVGLSLAGIIGVRPLVRALALRSVGELPIFAAIIVDGVPYAMTSPALAAQSFLIDARTFGLDPSRHDAAMAARLAAAVGNAERVIVACPSERMDDWSVALKSLEARSEILVPELMRFAPAKVAEFDRHPTLVVAGGPLQFRDRIVKRLFDLTVAGTATIVLAPVLLAAAAAVRLSSPGPILFRQQRLGRDARPFEIYKFRTMRQDMADAKAEQLTQRGDPRVTPVGAFLRRTSLDELPQLFNVLKGDMSVVGPRPHAAAARAADKLYWEVDERYWERHCIKPGMTGLAQVRGHRGATDAHEDLVNRLQSDLEYVTRWSVWRDIRILAATLRVLVHHNAY
jgi:exopolysaccharide biosynthesis polyprenyl glycosylphosphotransferase